MTDPDTPNLETRLAQLRAATEALEGVVADRSVLAHLNDTDRHRLINAAAAVYHPDPIARRKLVRETKRIRKAARVNAEEEVLTSTGIRELRRRPVFTTPNVFPPADFQQEDVEDPDFVDAVSSKHCYVCKQHYDRVHHFYDQLCPDCATLNYHKRTELADLRGRVALLTGGRVKIGYQAGLKLLRSGAHLIVTTRFPRDSAMRYAEEPDFEEWRDRLEIYGLDLRHTPSVEAFTHEMLDRLDRLDFIVNNACQTVRRPPAFYAHMMAGETAVAASLPEHAAKLLGSYAGVRAYQALTSGQIDAALGESSAAPGLTHAAQLSQLPLLPEDLLASEHLFPDGRLDQDMQQVDLRGRNSWRLLMHEVSSIELMEVHLVNAVAPFILNARLKPLMLRTPERDKHIVNVSAMEGQFYRRFKTTRHPHTNMAKAALNMMTRTSATDYFNDGIHMNAVDTGWITDEDPAEIADRKVAEHRFHPPLDIVDGGARIVDPIIDGFNTGNHVWGLFLKDYRPTDW